MKVELTEEQVKALYQIVTRSQISGGDAEMIVGLKQAIAKAVQPEEAPKKEEKKN